MAGSTIRQSFCSALQAEVAEFYRLMAVLQEQSMREAPKPGSLSSGKALLTCLSHCLMLLSTLTVELGDQHPGPRCTAVVHQEGLQNRHWVPDRVERLWR